MNNDNSEVIIMWKYMYKRNEQLKAYKNKLIIYIKYRLLKNNNNNINNRLDTLV